MASGFAARGKRLRKNSGIASCRSSRTGTPTSRSGRAANTRKSGREWTWTSANRWRRWSRDRGPSGADQERRGTRAGTSPSPAPWWRWTSSRRTRTPSRTSLRGPLGAAQPEDDDRAPARDERLGLAPDARVLLVVGVDDHQDRPRARRSASCGQALAPTSRHPGAGPGAGGSRARASCRRCRRRGRPARRRASQSIARWAVTTTIASAQSSSSSSGVVLALDAVGVRERRRRAGRGSATSAPRSASPRDDVRGRRVAGVADVRLEGDAEDADLGALERPAAVVERLGDEVDDVARHREVDVAGELDEAVDEVELAGAPRQVVRVDRDAVAADARARRELHEPERLGRRRVDDLPDVEAHPLAQQRELVDERDVDVAEDVLEELRQLGGVGRRQLDDAGR